MATIAPTDDSPIQREVLNTFDKGHDLELHLSKVTVGQHTYAELRDYVPSRNVYMRCITLPIEMVDLVGKGLIDASSTIRRRKRVNRSSTRA